MWPGMIYYERADNLEKTESRTESRTECGKCGIGNNVKPCTGFGRSVNVRPRRYYLSRIYRTSQLGRADTVLKSKNIFEYSVPCSVVALRRTACGKSVLVHSM